MPLTPTERRSLVAARTNAESTLTTYSVVTFRNRDCTKHKAGFISDVALTCKCSHLTTILYDEALRLSDEAKDAALVYVLELEQSQARIKDDVVASMVEQVVTFSEDARSYVPTETVAGTGVRENKDGFLETFATTYTAKAAPVGERDLYRETAPDVSLRHADYSEELIVAITQMTRLPGGSYITYLVADGLATFTCKYCQEQHRSDTFVSTWDISQELFLAAIMAHYYECRKIATFKRVAQYKIDAQAFAFSTYGPEFGTPNRLKPEYVNVAKLPDGTVDRVTVLL